MLSLGKSPPAHKFAPYQAILTAMLSLDRLLTIFLGARVSSALGEAMSTRVSRHKEKEEARMSPHSRADLIRLAN